MFYSNEKKIKLSPILVYMHVFCQKVAEEDDAKRSNRGFEIFIFHN